MGAGIHHPRKRGGGGGGGGGGEKGSVNYTESKADEHNRHESGTAACKHHLEPSQSQSAGQLPGSRHQGSVSAHSYPLYAAAPWSLRTACGLCSGRSPASHWDPPRIALHCPLRGPPQGSSIGAWTPLSAQLPPQCRCPPGAGSQLERSAPPLPLQSESDVNELAGGT